MNDLYLDWCDAHVVELSTHYNSYVAIHLVDGIVVVDQNEDKFISKLRKLDVEYRKSLYMTHTFLYCLEGQNE